MNLKLNNQLAHLPNEISISRYEIHQRCLELFLSWPEDKYAFCPACKSYSCIKKGHSSVKTVYHIPIGTSSTFLTFAFPDVIICVDMFHVVQMLNENINSIRRYLQNEFRDKATFAKSQGNLSLSRKYTDQYILLKGASLILLTAEANQFESWKQHREKNLLRLEKIFFSLRN